MRKIIILILFMLSLTGTAFAEISIKAEVDKTSLTTDEALIYKLTVTAAAKVLPAPQLPDFKGFKVLSHATTSAISIKIDGPNVNIVHVFVLLPVEAGKLQIAPTTIKINQQTFSTAGFAIEVKQGKAKPAGPPGEKPLSPQDSQPKSEEPQITL